MVQESIVKRFVEEISPTQQFTDSYDDFVSNRVRELISLSRPIRASLGMKVKIHLIKNNRGDLKTTSNVGKRWHLSTNHTARM